MEEGEFCGFRPATVLTYICQDEIGQNCIFSLHVMLVSLWGHCFHATWMQPEALKLKMPELRSVYYSTSEDN